MADDITTIGAEFLVKYIFTESVSKPSSAGVGLYDSETDVLDESSDVGDITTEPDTGNYARLTYAFGATDYTADQDSNSDWQGNFVEKEFDLTDTTGYADSYFVAIDFNAAQDSSVTTHMFSFGPLLDSQGNQMRMNLGSSRSFFFSGATKVL